MPLWKLQPIAESQGSNAKGLQPNDCVKTQDSSGYWNVPVARPGIVTFEGMSVLARSSPGWSACERYQPLTKPVTSPSVIRYQGLPIGSLNGPSMTWTTSFAGTIPMRSASGAPSARMFSPDPSSVSASTYDPASNQSATFEGASETASSATTSDSVQLDSAGARY